jgi:hypothetical protein
MLILVPLIITMAVGLIIGLRLVGEHNADVRLSAHRAGLGGRAPTANASGAPASTASTVARAAPAPVPSG